MWNWSIAVYLLFAHKVNSYVMSKHTCTDTKNLLNKTLAIEILSIGEWEIWYHYYPTGFNGFTIHENSFQFQVSHDLVLLSARYKCYSGNKPQNRSHHGHIIINTFNNQLFFTFKYYDLDEEINYGIIGYKPLEYFIAYSCKNITPTQSKERLVVARAGKAPEVDSFFYDSVVQPLQENAISVNYMVHVKNNEERISCTEVKGVPVAPYAKLADTEDAKAAASRVSAGLPHLGILILICRFVTGFPTFF